MEPRVHESRRVRFWLALTLLSMAGGAGYTHAIHGHIEYGLANGLVIGGLLSGFEIFLLRAPLGSPLRALPTAVLLLTTICVWSVTILASLRFFTTMGPSLGFRPIPDILAADNGLARDMGFSLTMAVLVNSFARIEALVGGRVMLNLLAGRYFKPVREERVFMFLDVADSTQLSERLGDLRVQALLKSFFFDIAEPIAAWGGETHRYIGDEVVVTWPWHRAADGRCLRCVFAINELMQRRAEHYRRTFGVVPRFRVGMHGGPVVASEVGNQKLEIVYFGDTINTAARLASLGKETGDQTLLSGALLEHMTLPEGTRIRPLPDMPLKGKRHEVSIFAVN